MSTTDTIKADPELARRAAQLLASPYSVGTQDSAQLAEKQLLFLVLAGLKPVAEVASGHWEVIPDGRHTVFDDPIAVGGFLDELGLHHRLQHDTRATEAVVALKPELLDAYKTALDHEDVARIGELFGYHASAAQAFVPFASTGDDSELLPGADQDAVERQAGLADTFLVDFRFSRSHWQGELALCLRWQACLRQYGLM